MDRNTLLNEQQAADFLGGRIPVRTLQYWRAQRRGPVFVRLGRHVLYRPDDLRAFVAAGVVEPRLAKTEKR